MKKIFFFNISLIFLFFYGIKLYGSEKELLDLAESYYNDKDYYNTITEVMRYQYFYPQGKFYPSGMLLMGKAYYKGGNYFETIKAFSECHQKFPETPEGETALYLTGFARLTLGAEYYAYRTFLDYKTKYKSGIYLEDVSRDMCYNYVLLGDLNKADMAITGYQLEYSNGKYCSELFELHSLIEQEQKRPVKKLWLSVLGSVFIPGFSSFYVNDYLTGIFSIVSNVVCGYLFYDAYREKDKLRMIVFGYAEYVFYSYSLYSAFRNVNDFNRNDNFTKKITLMASKKF